MTNYNQLILYCLYCLSQKREEISFEDLLDECFTQFPSKFSFLRHEWPDARKLDRPLRFLREKKLLFQSNHGLRLTKKGKIQAQQLGKLLRQEKLF